MASALFGLERGGTRDACSKSARAVSTDLAHVLVSRGAAPLGAGGALGGARAAGAGARGPARALALQRREQFDGYGTTDRFNCGG